MPWVVVFVDAHDLHPLTDEQEALGLHSPEVMLDLRIIPEVYDPYIVIALEEQATYPQLINGHNGPPDP